MPQGILPGQQLPASLRKYVNEFLAGSISPGLRRLAVGQWYAGSSGSFVGRQKK